MGKRVGDSERRPIFERLMEYTEVLRVDETSKISLNEVDGL